MIICCLHNELEIVLDRSGSGFHYVSYNLVIVSQNKSDLHKYTIRAQL